MPSKGCIFLVHFACALDGWSLASNWLLGVKLEIRTTPVQGSRHLSFNASQIQCVCSIYNIMHSVPCHCKLDADAALLLVSADELSH